MKNEKLRLLESFGNQGWEHFPDHDRLILPNQDDTRRLEYKDWGKGYNGVRVSLGLYFLNQSGGWSEVMSVTHNTPEDGSPEQMTLMIVCSTPESDRLIFFDSDGLPREYGSSGVSQKPEGRVLEDRSELLYSLEDVPDKLDTVLTARLFIDQMIRGEMGRPVLVPRGLITLEEPSEGLPSAVAHAINIDRATSLLASAKTRTEKEVARAVHGWVVGQ